MLIKIPYQLAERPANPDFRYAVGDPCVCVQVELPDGGMVEFFVDTEARIVSVAEVVAEAGGFTGYELYTTTLPLKKPPSGDPA